MSRELRTNPVTPLRSTAQKAASGSGVFGPPELLGTKMVGEGSGVAGAAVAAADVGELAGVADFAEWGVAAVAAVAPTAVADAAADVAAGGAASGSAVGDEQATSSTARMLTE
jgi:hypothetical protein